MALKKKKKLSQEDNVQTSESKLVHDISAWCNLSSCTVRVGQNLVAYALKRHSSAVLKPQPSGRAPLSSLRWPTGHCARGNNLRARVQVCVRAFRGFSSYNEPIISNVISVVSSRLLSVSSQGFHGPPFGHADWNEK